MPELEELSVETLKMNPLNPGARTELARRLFVAGNPGEASRWLSWAIERYHYPAVNLLGVIKYSAGARAEAIDLFTRAAKQNGPAAWNLVVLFTNEGDHAAANTAAERYSVGSSIRALPGTLIDEK